MSYQLCIVVLAICTAAAGAPAADTDTWTAPAPLSPEESLKTIVVPEGFAVELVATEPLVMDPVAFAWGPDMRLWVVEMADYNWLPVNDKSDKKPKGRVVYLTDTNGDGRYDTRTIFLDNLDYPTGVLPWRKGVLVTAAPDILYAEDTTAIWVADDEKAVEKGAKPKNFRIVSKTGGKADKIDKLYTGFAEGNPQLRVNGLQWGLDNWIYCANGLSNGVVKSNKTGQTVDIRGRDVRIRPDTGEIEPASGPSQFGRVRDDFGNWFGVDNSRLIIHYVLEDHYLRRNPHVAAPEPFIDLVTPRNPPCFPIGKKAERLHAPYMANRFTSACGIAVYRDNYLGDDVYGQVFICEPVHNLITRRKLTPDGVTFKAERVAGEEQKEFLASSDEWFRPVHLRTGPDGALYIADMYRAVVEHPQWLPKEFNKKVDWMQGSDKGRIYRVVKKGLSLRPLPMNGFIQRAESIELLQSPNGCIRDLASMALLWSDPHWVQYLELTRVIDVLVASPDNFNKAKFDEALQKRTAVRAEQHAGWHPHRSQIARATTMANPAVRVQAISLLNQVELLVGDELRAGLSHSHPGVVAAAIRNVETQYVLESDGVQLERFLPHRLGNRHGSAALQWALSVGSPNMEKYAAPLLVELFQQRPTDPYMTAALISASAKVVPHVLEELLTSKRPAASYEVITLLSRTVALTDDPDALTDVMKLLTVSDAAIPRDRRLAAILGIIQGVETAKRGTLSVPQRIWAPLISEGKVWPDFFASLVLQKPDLKQPEDEHVMIIRLLGVTKIDRSVRYLLMLLEPSVSTRLQLEAIESLGALPAGDVNDSILSSLFFEKQWKQLTPTVRLRMIDMFLRRPETTRMLLQRVAAKQVMASEISTANRQRLAGHPTESIAKIAKQLFGAITTDRARMVEAHKDVVGMNGDLTRGRELFERTCAVCHKIAGQGKGFGPDLGALSDRSPQALLTAILDPNQAVDPRYLNYVVETKDDGGTGGETFTGMLLAETATGITLVGADGVKRTILRKDVASLRSTSLSLMPEGLEQSLGKQGLADVIAFVASRSQPARVLEGVKATLIKPNPDGSLVLPATACDAFGKTITYEKEDNNLGLWSSADDFAAWTIEPRAAGKFEVWLDYASDKTWLNNSAAISAENDEGHASSFAAKIESTGTFNDYQQSKVGTVELAAGRQRLIIRPSGPITGRLMDLRGVRLVPVK